MRPASAGPPSPGADWGALHAVERQAPPGQAAAAALAEFSRHYDGLLRFLKRRTGCAETARDLAHDTWVRLAARRPDERLATSPAASPADLMGTGSPQHADGARAYLYTVAANLAANLHRHDALGQSPGILALAADRLHVATGDVARTHSLRQAIAAIERALAALPERRRGIFIAHRLDGEPHEALARQHGVSVKTVEREITLALDALHATLAQWRGDAPGTARPRGRRQVLSKLLGLGGVGTALAAGTWAWRWSQAELARFELALATPRGQRLKQALPDGSTLVLDAASRADVAFDASRRVVQLRTGSAWFDVARDAARPFTVDTALARVVVLGTRFALDLEEAVAGLPAALVATVEHGHVRVWPAAGARDEASTGRGGSPAAIDLHAGDHLRLTASGATLARADGHAPAETPEPAAPWRDGWLDFRGTPLAQAVQRLARYHARSIQVADAVAGLPVLGRVRIADAEQWLRLLPTILPVRVRTAGDGGLRIEAAR